MSKTIPNMQDNQQQQMFSYIFTEMMPNKFGSLKLGIAIGLLNCTYKTLYLNYKSKLWIFSNQNEFVKTFLKMHISAKK